MKILVAVKRAVDLNVRVRVKPDGSGVDLQNVKMSMNPFDEIAVEEAVRLKEAGVATEVVAVSVGPAQAQDVLRAALAMGADRAILVKSDKPVEPLGVAKVLKAIAEKEGFDLVLLGKQAIDDDCNQTGQMLAALMDRPQATFAATMSIEEGSALVTREVDHGLETLRVALPAVVTVELGLNQPRYASLPAIMKARSKPLEEVEAASFGVDLAPRLDVLEVTAPPKRAAGELLGSVDELVARLRADPRRSLGGA
ncbi:MAG: electron transfer flavoprotein subunit beta/FixA family protein [Hyphomicrobiaceae bacterium]|nr:electron transfer flavoprotein subunit beta/FixA family protein [Hyphomicrobiaceae bacterium]